MPSEGGGTLNLSINNTRRTQTVGLTNRNPQAVTRNQSGNLLYNARIASKGSEHSAPALAEGLETISII